MAAISYNRDRDRLTSSSSSSSSTPFKPASLVYSPSELKRRKTPSENPVHFSLLEKEREDIDTERLFTSLPVRVSPSLNSATRHSLWIEDDKYNKAPLSLSFFRLPFPFSFPLRFIEVVEVWMKRLRIPFRSTTAPSHNIPSPPLSNNTTSHRYESSVRPFSSDSGRRLSDWHSSTIRIPCGSSRWSVLRLCFFSCLAFSMFFILSALFFGGWSAWRYFPHPLWHAFAWITRDRLELESPLSSYQFTIVASLFDSSDHSKTNTKAQTMIQWHSLLSFTTLVPPEYVMIYTNRPDYCSSFVSPAFPTMNCFAFPDSDPTHHLPHVKTWFEHVHQYSPTDLIVYAHHDVLLSPALSATIHALIDEVPHHQFFATSSRLDTKLTDELINPESFSTSYVNDIVQLSAEKGKRYANEFNFDFFVYSRAMFRQVTQSTKIPGFLYSDYYWNNWLVSLFLHDQTIVCVDVSDQRLVIHQKTNDTIDGIYVENMRTMHVFNRVQASRANEDFTHGNTLAMPFALNGNCERSCVLDVNPNMGLQALLARHASPNRWIWMLHTHNVTESSARNWLCWAQAAHIENFLLISTSSHTAYWETQLFREGFPIIFLSNHKLTLATMAMYALKQHYNVLLSDWIHVPLQSPFKYLETSPYDVSLVGDDQMLYEGILAIRSTINALAFISAYEQCEVISAERPLAEQSSSPSHCATTVFRDMRYSMPINAGLLDYLHFPTTQHLFLWQTPQRSGITPLVVEIFDVVAYRRGLFLFDPAYPQQCRSFQPIPFLPPTLNAAIASPPVHVAIKVLTSTKLAALKVLLNSLLNARYDAGSVVDLQICVDFPFDTTQIISYKAVVEYSTAFTWPLGSFLVSVQDKVHAGSSRMLHMDMPSIDTHTFVLVLEDGMMVSSIWFRVVRDLIYAYYFTPARYDSNLYAISLAMSDQLLGEDIVHSSRGRHFLDELDLANEHTLFFYQRPTSALLFFPSHWSELAEWMRRVQIQIPSYRPCVTTLISNEMTDGSMDLVWWQWVTRWVFQKGWYALHTRFSNNKVLAAEQQPSVTLARLATPLLTLVDYEALNLTAAAHLPSELSVYDFHGRALHYRSVLAMRSSVIGAPYSLQCWLVSDWLDMPQLVPDLQDDESWTGRPIKDRTNLLKWHDSIEHPVVNALPPDEELGPVAGVFASNAKTLASGSKQNTWQKAAYAAVKESEPENDLKRSSTSKVLSTTKNATTSTVNNATVAHHATTTSNLTKPHIPTVPPSSRSQTSAVNAHNSTSKKTSASANSKKPASILKTSSSSVSTKEQAKASPKKKQELVSLSAKAPTTAVIRESENTVESESLPLSRSTPASEEDSLKASIVDDT